MTDNYQLLLVEDNSSDIQNCEDAVAFHNEELDGEKIVLTIKNNLSDALAALDNSFDGAIIDLKLEGQESGNEAVEKIRKLNLRIPVAIVTGTPGSADLENLRKNYLGVFKKGECTYEEILNDLWSIHKSSITRIIGGKGKIEQELNRIFESNLVENRKTWQEYGQEDSKRTENALLRYVASHLLYQLDDGTSFFPEEVYLYSPDIKTIQMGSIFKHLSKAEQQKNYTVLNPDCDLVIRSNGTSKAESILLVEIENEKDVVNQVLGETKKESKKRGKLEELLKNNFAPYYHRLPQTSIFEGGFLNFRKTKAVSKEELENEYENTLVKIAPSFGKDVQARMASFNARSGQPDIDHKRCIERLLTALDNS